MSQVRTTALAGATAAVGAMLEWHGFGDVTVSAI